MVGSKEESYINCICCFNIKPINSYTAWLKIFFISIVFIINRRTIIKDVGDHAYFIEKYPGP